VSEDIRFISAGTLTLEGLAELFTRSFEQYFYPGAVTAADLARRVRVEQIDLWRSPVLVVDGEPAGLALLGLRGTRAWCGGFGVVLARRGRGLSHRLTGALIEYARAAGAEQLSLEVLTRNERAIRAYSRAGFRTVRDLRILEWRRPADAPPPDAPPAVEAAPEVLLRSFGRLHPVRPAWQRDLASLLVRDSLSGLALGPAHAPRAYALLQAGADGSARLMDLGAESAGDAQELLAALQARYTSLISVNEPTDAPATPAFDAAGFAEADRQHEMVIYVN